MILAIDTATRWTGLALYDGRQVLAEMGWNAKSSQTVELAPAVVGLLRRAGVEFDDLKGLAVAIGPGSYTGLRIGLGFAKGLSLANGLQIVGIPTLDIVAAAAPEFAGKLLVTAEAGRTRLCAGIYSWQGKRWRPAADPFIAALPEIIAQLQGPTLVAGELSPEAARQIRTSDKPLTILPAASSVRRPAVLAELGWKRLRRGKTDSPETLAPIYLQKPGG